MIFKMIYKWFLQPFYFVDDTCLLNIENTISKNNKILNADEIAQNVAKT